MQPGVKHILLVDDLPEVVECWRWGLESQGYSVACHTDPRSAIAAIEANPSDFDVLVSDLSMPDMSGLELIASVRQVCPKLPVIVCTGHDHEDWRQAALTLGVDRVLSKPVWLDELSEALAAAAGQGR